ncbi:hypothetical protein PLICRDRAFT_697259 [Plicaturopsis crispa FD-325 SS-3]|nr:hypothetical protein PLICRDRAFT_697259 [Plicaturopsis crispa FD-325 SS-3]
MASSSMPVCDGCNKVYAQESHLSRHTKTCEGVAENARKSFSLSRQLRKLGRINPAKILKRRRLDSAASGSSVGARSHDIPQSSRAGPGSASTSSHEQRRFDDDNSLEIRQSSRYRASSHREDSAFDDMFQLDGQDISMDDAQIPSPPRTSSTRSEMTQDDVENAPLPEPNKRVRRPTQKARAALVDALPEGPGALEPAVPETAPAVRRVVLRVREKIRTTVNSFGLSREYQLRPTCIPDMDLPFEVRVADSDSPHTKVTQKRAIADIIFPYPNISSFLFGYWYRKGSDKKTKGERKALIDVMLDPRFDSRDLLGVNFDRIDEQIAADIQSPWGGNGWHTDTVVIEVPTGIKATKATKRKQANAAQSARRHDEVDPDADKMPVHKFRVPNVHHRSLVHILRSVVEEDPASKYFHWHSYTEHWQPPDPAALPEQVFGEMYASEAFRKAERELLRSPPEPNCELPRVIAGFMFWSDATHVAQFGQSKLWPVYGYFANQSKYTRCKPSSRAAHHVAFVETLPDEFDDWLRRHGINPTDPLLAHCRRELFHAIWTLLLDGEFLEAYRHGIVLRCADGILRRVYLRIFTYSADYPEKVLIASIRDMGGCPCPRCKIRKDQIPGLATSADTAIRIDMARHDDDARRSKVSAARQKIYKDGYVVNSDHVDDLLKAESLVPTVNAFSERLSSFRFDLFLMLVVDLMHEFELGVWKALLTHLVRILHSLGRNTVLLFNERFRQVPTFGRSTIRRFAHNVADMKKLAARDFEDILQCCIPCFEGLLPAPHDESVADLLYLATYWHSLAKLRMHTDSSLKVLDKVTVAFGQAIRHFADVTCPAFDTVETDAEYASRGRAERRRQQKATENSNGQAASTNTPMGKRQRTFNLQTAKLHFLGDYGTQIRFFGTTDSYNTQIGELEHRVVKKRHGRGSKKHVVPQLVKLDVNETVHDRMAEELAAASSPPPAFKTDVEDVGNLEDMARHHRIAAGVGERIYLGDWVQEHRTDAASKDFLPRLKSHLLARLQGHVSVGDEPQFQPEELSQIHFQSDCIHRHATATFNYTTYDLRRDQDTINPSRDRRNVIVLSNEDRDDEGQPPHPF